MRYWISNDWDQCAERNVILSWFRFDDRIETDKFRNANVVLHSSLRCCGSFHWFATFIAINDRMIAHEFSFSRGNLVVEHELGSARGDVHEKWTSEGKPSMLTVRARRKFCFQEIEKWAATVNREVMARYVVCNFVVRFRKEFVDWGPFLENAENMLFSARGENTVHSTRDPWRSWKSGCRFTLEIEWKSLKNFRDFIRNLWKISEILSIPEIFL